MLNGDPFMQISHCSTVAFYLKPHLCYLMISILSINVFIYPENIDFGHKNCVSNIGKIMLNGSHVMQISHYFPSSMFLKPHVCYLMISILSINVFRYPDNRHRNYVSISYRQHKYWIEAIFENMQISHWSTALMSLKQHICY